MTQEYKNNLEEKNLSPQEVENLMNNLSVPATSEGKQISKALSVPFGYLNGHDVIDLFSDVNSLSLDTDLALQFARALIVNKGLKLQELNEKFVVMHIHPNANARS